MDIKDVSRSLHIRLVISEEDVPIRFQCTTRDQDMLFRVSKIFLDPILKVILGSTVAMKWHMDSAVTCTEIWMVMKGSVREAKNWLRKERSARDISPKNHMLNVYTGRLGTSKFVATS
ncbi:hypothetical protein MRB53_029053 [Persea americana]|uniref:Uncharacterized protein n=1 Tax=Persea americana TaxID=3435 RepID=A0ACC2KH92_PERAE|nr:hypothetical protein MRB53_029053 [Persea americana]